jgi:hypothetical protein
MNNRQKQIDVDRLVAAIDETRQAEHFRSPTRARQRQDPAISRAKTRLRTAVYRNRLDQRRAASTDVIGRAMVRALVTANLESITAGDRDVIGRALLGLRDAGYSLTEVRDTLRRLRRRLVIDSDDDIASPSTH